MEKNVKKTESGNKNTLIIIIAVVAVLLIGGFAIQKIVMKNVGERLAEGIIKKETGGKVNLDVNTGKVKIKNEEGTFETETNAKWPDGMPGDIPKFSKGKIKMSVNTKAEDSKNWNIIVSEIDENAVNQYKSELENKGFVQESSIDVGVKITEMKKDKLSVNLAYDSSSKGVSITVSEKLR